MPQFQMQHKRGGKKGATTTLRAVGLLMALFLLVALGIEWIKNIPASPGPWMPAPPEDRYFLPAADSATLVIHNPLYSIGTTREGALVWAACEYDARMEKAFAFPDSLFPQIEPDMLPSWHNWQEKSLNAARRLGRLFVISGPVPPDPRRHFMVWLDEGYQRLEGVGVLFPDQAVVPIDSVEELTGLDLFAEYWLDSLEIEVEKSVNLTHWNPEIR